jgi:transposase-like protein
MPTRPAIFKWRQTEPALILCAVRWYLRCSLSLREVEELLEERGLGADHTTVSRWVQRYSPELKQRIRRHLKPTNKSWRVNKTYVRVKGRWCYPVSSHRFHRCHHRFPVVCAARRRCVETAVS